MIITEEEVKERLDSPANLLNRLRSETNSRKKVTHPSIPPSSSEIIEDLEEKLAYGSIKSKAAGIMITAMDELRNRLPEVQRPEKLASIASEMGKIVHAEIKDKKETDNNQFIVYAPQFVKEEHYETIYVRE
jgi:hypothetical protein